MDKKPETKLRRLFDAAVSRAHPNHCMQGVSWPKVSGRIVVAGAGKAAAAMAQAVENRQYHFDAGLVITQNGAHTATKRIEVVEARHPVPDERGRDATNRILNLAQSLGEGDALVVLLSGGGSSLLCAPAQGITLTEKQSITHQLISSGASIDEINGVRKHLSAIKGGRLAEAAYPAICATFAISDVAGDAPSTIASGPTVADPSTQEEARLVLTKYGISVGKNAQGILSDPKFETPKPGATTLSKQTYSLVATPQVALYAAAVEAERLGLEVEILDDNLEGSTIDLAIQHADHLRTILKDIKSGKRNTPFVLLSGGEATVDMRGHQDPQSRGGPNQEFALELAKALDGTAGVYALCADTDGKDGNSDAAGAFVSPQTLALAETHGLSLDLALERHTSTEFFEAIGASFVTGPTHTNVNDFRAILVDPSLTP